MAALANLLNATNTWVISSFKWSTEKISVQFSRAFIASVSCKYEYLNIMLVCWFIIDIEGLLFSNYFIS